MKSRFERRDSRHFSWSGKVSDDPFSMVVLVAGDGQMLGSVFTHGKHYSIRGGDGGSQEVAEVDQSALPKELCDQSPAGDQTQSVPALPSLQDAAADSGSAIDVLVVYTAAVQSASGGGANWAQFAIDAANTSYGNSGVTPRLNLVHAEQVSYTETATYDGWSSDLNRLAGTSEGYMDDIHSLRDAYHADIVVLMVSNDTACGLSAAIMATESSAFTVLDYYCAVYNYTLGHEIGHLQGARHDRYADAIGYNPPSSVPPDYYNYNHGDVDLTLRMRTVMAYNNQCSATAPYDYCTRVPYWSNPGVNYPGYSRSTGGTYENNVQVLNNTAYTVANFRQAPPPTAQLTVQSASPASGVTITANTADRNGLTGGTTSFTLTYAVNDPVTLTAEASVGGYPLLSWSGCAGTSGLDCTVVVDGDKTVTATYSVNQAPGFLKGADQAVLEDAGAQTIAGWATGIGPGAAGESAQIMTFTVTNDNNALFGVQPAVAADGTLTYTPAANQAGSAMVTVTLSDDGGTANGGSDTSGSQTFMITVTGVNDAPSFAEGTSQVVLEDAGLQTVTGWATGIGAGAASESAQILTFTVTTDKKWLFSVQPAVAADGTLTFAVAADKVGSATVTVVLSDDGGTADGGIDTSASRSFTVKATAVNDAPSFVMGADQTVLEDGGVQTVAGWATSMSAGPANESAQLLTFRVTNNRNALFSVQPAVAADGTLTYTPGPDQRGIATVTVVLKDNGGTRNGGSNASAPQSITITVTSVNDAPSFLKGSDQTISVNTGAHSVTGWATNISAGPANESFQVLKFTVTSDNGALFSVPPAVGPDGTLTYTAAADKTGSAGVTVVLKDNGGTANGGDNTSAPQSFTITVNPSALADSMYPSAFADSMNPSVAATSDVAGAVTLQTATTSLEFQEALTVAQSNGAPDLIRLAGGTYALSGNGNAPFTYAAAEDKGLVIEGGWTPDFSLRAANITTELKHDIPTTLSGNGGVLGITAGGNVTLEGLTISGGDVDGSGGGLYLQAAGTIVVGNCQLLGNTATGDGGGLFLESTAGDAWFSGNTVRWNSGAAAGGGLIKAMSASVYANEFSGNSALAVDGGLQVSVTSGGKLFVGNNTIHGNQAPAGSSGLSVAATGARGMSVLEIHNNIVYGNGIAPNFVVAPDSDCVMNYLDLNITNNDIACYEMCPEYLLDGSNISVDFSGRGAGTIRLAAADTALIDRGAAYTMSFEDFEGDTIPMDGDGDASAVPDIGADEYNPVNVAGPAAAAVSSSGTIATAGGSATITVALDRPAKRDLVLYLAKSDTGVVTLSPQYLLIRKGRNSAQAVVQAMNGVQEGTSTITVTDPSGMIANVSLTVTVAVAN